MRNSTKLWAACLIGGTMMAQAASLTNSATWINHETDWGPTTNSVAKFDTHLGLLTQVVFMVHSDMDTQFHATESENVGTTGTVWTTFTMSIVDPLSLLTTPQMNLTFPGAYPDGGFSFRLAPYATTNSQVFTSHSDYAETFDFGSPVLAEFSSYGAGSLDLSGFTGTDTLTSFVGGNANVGQITNAGADVLVIYNYAAIPEPAAAALAGLGCLAFYVRRRFQQIRRYA